MNATPWGVRLSQHAVGVVKGLPDHARELVRDVLDIAARSPWGWPQWDANDPEGEDVRAASLGNLSVVYVVNRPMRHISVLDVIWLD